MTNAYDDAIIKAQGEMKNLTIKKRLFLSNIFMLLIPALVSILVVAVSLLLFTNIFYKQIMDETVRGENTVHLERLLVEQSKEFLKSDQKDVTKSKLYQTVEKYIDTQDIQLQIYQEDTLICSMGDKSQELAEMPLYTLSGGNVYVESVIEDGKKYMIYIAFFAPIKESSWNESAVAYLIVILAALIVTAVLMTNRFLTKFVFRRIERPLDILVSGVHEIQDGNLACRIDYHEKDEFYSVCTDFNHMAEQLQRSIEQTEREERSRKELIAGISHDLRTPLTSIKAYIEGLMEGVAQTPERQQKYMRTIREKANDIDRMVDKLFLFSKLDLGDSPFYPEPLPVAETLQSLLAENAEEYAKQGMTIILEPISSDCIVYADPVQFRNAITNLLENSLKYKDAPEVEVHISCTATISVSDNGPGVSDEALSKLFDVFYRSDPSRNNPQKGSGLGLAITAKILERFGGTIRAEHETPKGLRILLTIPKEETKNESYLHY